MIVCYGIDSFNNHHTICNLGPHTVHAPQTEPSHEPGRKVCGGVQVATKIEQSGSWLGSC